MKQLILLFICCILIIACRNKSEISRQKIKFPDYSQDFKPSSNQVNLFQLSQEYPDTFSVNEQYPWTGIDFKTDYKSYISTVMDYCLEGNIEVDFKVQENKIRKWYNAPWLHYGMNGREYYHGLTRERPVPIQELHSKQNVWLENWAIGYYNQPGGYTIGKVWTTDTVPNPKFAEFPEGTVAFKLLFTAGTIDKVPFLKGSKEWKANIYSCNPETGSQEQKAECRSKRVDSIVRLLQIDIAVKDSRASGTGWVFGTFIYDASRNGQTVWEKMVPVGLMWGDDSRIDTMINREGSFINQYLKQTVLNKDLIEVPNMEYDIKAYMSHHGLGGRLNGPVDNPISSCISCHSKAAVTDFGLPAPMANFRLTRQAFTKIEFNKYFADINGRAGKIKFDTTEYNQLDYSLQLSAGIRNYYQSIIDKKKANEEGFAPSNIKDLPEVTRNGLQEDE